MMKALTFPLTVLLIFCAMICHAQNGLTGPAGLYGSSYIAATTMRSGGSIYVGNGGNWWMGGSITSADKGNPNSPSALGQSEVITFDGTGKVSNAVTTPGSAGNYINGYAATTGTSATAMVLPVGGTSAVYPFTVPAGAAVKVAYFDGSGSTTAVPVNGTPTIEFSQYYDLPAGWPGGTYSLSYPSGLTPGFNAILTSTAGTSFSLETNIPNISMTAGTVASASFTASTATRLYLSTSPVLLPIQLEYFRGSRQVGYNLLQWGVTDPWDVDHFQVYKQGSQSSLFVPVFVSAANDNLLSYSFQDPADTGSAYYQLALVGKDGSVSRSQIVYLPANDNGSTAVSVFPNPASSALSVSLFSRSAADFYCAIYDMKGQKMGSKLVTIDGNAVVQWDVSALPKGVYMLNVRNGQTGAVQNVQFVKI